MRPDKTCWTRRRWPIVAAHAVAALWPVAVALWPVAAAHAQVPAPDRDRARLPAQVQAPVVTQAQSAAQHPAPHAPVDARQIVGAVCAACHGADGNSSGEEYPVLAQQGAAYLYDQLVQFAAQGRRRASGVMGAIAVNLSLPEMRALADYFSHQDLKPKPTDADPAAVARGESIYLDGIADRNVPACASCHGVRGQGLPAAFPRLAGQHARYVAAQLREFRAGRRASDPSAQMRVVAAGLSDADMEAVAQYVAALPRLEAGVPPSSFATR